MAEPHNDPRTAAGGSERQDRDLPAANAERDLTARSATQSVFSRRPLRNPSPGNAGTGSIVPCLSNAAPPPRLSALTIRYARRLRWRMSASQPLARTSGVACLPCESGPRARCSADTSFKARLAAIPAFHYSFTSITLLRETLTRDYRTSTGTRNAASGRRTSA